MNDAALKPCPFCGGEAKLTDPDARIYFWVECSECHAKSTIHCGGHGASPAESIAAWNRRAVAQAETVADLRHKCAMSGLHDHDGCSCTDTELLHRAAPITPSPSPPDEVRELWGWLCNGRGDGWEERDKIVRDPELADRYRAQPDKWAIQPLYLGMHDASR